MFKKLSYLVTVGLAILAAACSPDTAHAQIINPNPPQVAASAVAGTGLSQAGAVISVVYGTTAGTSMQGNTTVFPKVNTTNPITAATNSAPSGMGTLTYTDTNIFGSWQTSVNSFAQLILQNSNAGAVASTGYITSNDLGTATTFYGEFGMNSSGFTGTGSFNLPSATYFTSTSGDLAIGTTTANAIHFLVNSAATDSLAISSTGLLTGTALDNIGASYSSIVDASSALAASTTAQTIDTFSATVFRSTKYVVQVTQGSTYQVSELLVLTDGTNTFLLPYALISSTGSQFAALSSTIVGGNLVLSVTFTTASAGSVKLSAVRIRV